MQKRSIVPIVYILFLMLPIYWLVAMSFKTTNEILAGFSLFPQTFTWENFNLEEQAKVLKAPRSNNLMATDRVRTLVHSNKIRLLGYKLHTHGAAPHGS